MPELNRRNFVRAAGAAGAAAAFPGTATADPTGAVADGLSVDGGQQEAIVVFRDADDQSLLDAFDLAARHDYAVLPMTWARLTGDQIRTLAADERVRYVSDTYELEYYNDLESRKAMHSKAANDAGYDGADVDVAVIDSGVDATHPDLRDHVESNYVYVDDPFGERNAMWEDVGTADSDRVGHGTHCCGTVAGDGTASASGASTRQATYLGMAPEARLSSYAVGQAVYLPYAVGAWDHLLQRKRDDSVDFDPVACSNSYGVARGNRYNPLDPLNVATWEAFTDGVLPVFALGNDGPGEGTASRYAKAPHVLGVAAAQGSPDDKSIADFSSRGRSVGTALPDGSTVTPVYHDRRKLLRNLTRYHEATTEGQIRQLSDTLTGTLDPAVNAAGYADAGGSVRTHEVDLPREADLLEGFLDVTPDGQQVTVSFYTDYGTPDEELLARMGEEPVYIHHDVALDVPGGETLTVEFESENGPRAQYEFDFTVYRTVSVNGNRNTDLDRLRPVTLYRPGITTHGAGVMSTVNKYDAVGALGPLYGNRFEEPFYGPLSGTSMACPAAAGIAALVVQAGREAGLEYVGYGSERAGARDTFTPLDVITTVEATAEEAREDYTVANAGPGYVNAEAAVSAAAAGTFPGHGQVDLVGPSLTVRGSRADDAQAFRPGHTNHVEITVDRASHGATVYDEIPAEWTVVSGQPVEPLDGEGRKRVELGSVEAGDSRTFDYFVRAPDSTGEYVFGPARATTARGAVADTDAFGGTETNTVVGGPPDTGN